MSVSRSLESAPLFTKQVAISDLKDALWYQVDIPTDVKITKGEHLFISIRTMNSSAPYASVRYAQDPIRGTPIYISRTGNIDDAVQKPGSLGLELMYVGIDGKQASELETKLLR